MNALYYVLNSLGAAGLIAVLIWGLHVWASTPL